MRSCEVWNFGCGAVEFGAVEYVAVKCEVWSFPKRFRSSDTICGVWAMECRLCSIGLWSVELGLGSLKV